MCFLPHHYFIDYGKSIPMHQSILGLVNGLSICCNNPDVDEIVSCNAPWHNKQTCKFPANSIKTLFSLKYILLSDEVRNLRKNKYTHGIDYLGSRQGSWLLKLEYRFDSVLRDTLVEIIGALKALNLKSITCNQRWFKIHPNYGYRFKIKIGSRPRIFSQRIDSASRNWNLPIAIHVELSLHPVLAFPKNHG